MHISEGVLSPAILIGGAVVTMAGVAIGPSSVSPDTKRPAWPHPRLEGISRDIGGAGAPGLPFPVWRHYNSRRKYHEYGPSCRNMLLPVRMELEKRHQTIRIYNRRFCFRLLRRPCFQHICRAFPVSYRRGLFAGSKTSNCGTSSCNDN